MNYPKISKIKVLPETYTIFILFDNGVTKKVDFTYKLEDEFYENLNNKVLFQQAQVDIGGYGISWNDDIDISEYELWNLGEEQNELSI